LSFQSHIWYYRLIFDTAHLQTFSEYGKHLHKLFPKKIMDFPERLEIVMKSQLLDVMQLAHLLGVNERNIRNYLSGQTMPKIEFAENIYRRLPQISPNWLLTGEGEMLAAPVNGHVQVVQGNGHVGQVTQHIGTDPCAGYKAKVAELEKEVAYLQKINALLEAAQTTV
jgi:hypothetical protein